jgi:hypothetical protein
MWNDEDDFLDDMNSIDPVDSERLKSIWESELEKSMRFAYSMIEEMGIKRWTESIPISKERKITILNNMLDWHVNREEYEKCSIIKKGLDEISS